MAYWSLVVEKSIELWRPSAERIEQSYLYQFQQRISTQLNTPLETYQDLHQYSIDRPVEFWQEVMLDGEVIFEGELHAGPAEMSFDRYEWFPQVRLNFAENLLQKGEDQHLALNFVHEMGARRALDYQSLRSEVARMQAALRPLIGRGDVVAAYMPNIPETVIAMLGATSLGGVFTSTSCDFGVDGVVERFAQSRPKVLVACSGYTYQGKYFDQTAKVAEIAAQLPSVERVVMAHFLGAQFPRPEILGIEKSVWWEEFLPSTSGEITFLRRPFAAPLYILYSSGTTGKPKCIVHSVGGVLLQHVKELRLHTNIGPQSNVMFFTTCGWMMWNWLTSALSQGAAVTLYEGSPAYPRLIDFFQIIDRENISVFGTSPKFLKALEETNPIFESTFPGLEILLSTGAPLLPEQYDFIYQKIKADLQVSSISGGTDIIGCFFLGAPILPVIKGELQCKGLGMDVRCLDESGRAVVGQVGELVCAQSFPSRPISFLNDQDGQKMHQAYFEKYPGLWHHGDFLAITERGGAIILGRSDATLNPGGVRIGTSEIYRQTELLSYVEDSICVGREVKGDVAVVLFLKLKEQEILSEQRVKEIKALIRAGSTPRHVPAEIYSVAGIPYTRSGKKMEMVINRLINAKKITNSEVIANPECLEEYLRFANQSPRI